MREKQFMFFGSSVAYRITGKGFPVILLHGFAEDGHIWDLQIPALEKYFTVIVPDLPGSGHSTLQTGTGVPEVSPGTIEFYRDAVAGLLQVEGLEEGILLGHSMGGYITLAFAEKYPAKLRAFGLVNSTAFSDSAEKKLQRSKGIKFITEYGTYPFLKNSTPGLFAPRFKQEHPDRIAELIENGKKIPPGVLVSYYEAMLNRPERTGVLITRKPVLFIIGEADTAAPAEDLLKQVTLPFIAYIHILRGVGHMSMWEATAQLNNCLIGFASDVLEFERQ